MLAGIAQGLRRQTKDTRGMMKPCTKQNMYGYWGDALEHLVPCAMKIIKNRGALYINSRENGRRVESEDIRGLELAAVSYKGDGKYDHSTLLLWQDIPDTSEHQHNFNLLPPHGQGWWPVINIVCHELHRRDSCLIICFYQLQAEELIAWWIDHRAE